LLAIRLGRIGKSSQPSFRIIVQEKTASPKSKSLEVLGSYNPKAKSLKINRERVEYWMSKGAHPSSTLAGMLKKEGFSNMEKYIKKEQHKKKKKGEESAENKTTQDAQTGEKSQEAKTPQS